MTADESPSSQPPWKDAISNQNSTLWNATDNHNAQAKDGLPDTTNTNDPPVKCEPTDTITTNTNIPAHAKHGPTDPTDYRASPTDTGTINLLGILYHLQNDSKGKASKYVPHTACLMCSRTAPESPHTRPHTTVAELMQHSESEAHASCAFELLSDGWGRRPPLASIWIGVGKGRRPLRGP